MVKFLFSILFFLVSCTGVTQSVNTHNSILLAKCGIALGMKFFRQRLILNGFHLSTVQTHQVNEFHLAYASELQLLQSFIEKPAKNACFGKQLQIAIHRGLTHLKRIGLKLLT